MPAYDVPQGNKKRPACCTPEVIRSVVEPPLPVEMKLLPGGEKTINKLCQMCRPAAGVMRIPLSNVSKVALEVRIHTAQNFNFLEVMQTKAASEFPYNAEANREDSI